MLGEKGEKMKVTLRVLGEGVSIREVGEGARVMDLVPTTAGRNVRVNGHEASEESLLVGGDVVDIIPQYKNG
jgi:hypothetical protein